jgi:predicted short-subunit dehydrogenase-like oxidoreductase (DUF2520 family)
MNIIIIGSGNVATVLGRAIHSAGHRIVQVFSYHPEHAERLAILLQAKPVSSLEALEKKADLILVAIPDDAYRTFIPDLPPLDSFVVHTAGSVSMEVLKPTGNRYGVLYPLQSFRRELETPPEFPLLIDASNAENMEWLRRFAMGLSSTVIQATDDLRLRYHLGAVLVNNFTNHLFTLTESWCRAEGISFRLLEPLIAETAGRLKRKAPASLQTGPAFRNDTQTLKNHLDILESYPELSNLYKVLTESIRTFHHPKP